MIILFYVFVILLAWFFQNNLHEFSHLLVGKIVEGRKFIKLIPWPHKFGGKFYFARYESGPATKSGSPKFRHIAPVMGAASLFFIATLVLIITHKLFVVAFIVCPIVDICFWMYGYLFNRPTTDGFRFKELVKKS